MAGSTGAGHRICWWLLSSDKALLSTLIFSSHVRSIAPKAHSCCYFRADARRLRVQAHFVGQNAAEIGLNQHRLYRKPWTGPACVVVRGTIEQEPIAHGTEATIPSSAPLSLASYEEVVSGPPQIPKPFSLAPTRALLTGKAINIYCGSVVEQCPAFSGLLGRNYLTRPGSDGSGLCQEQRSWQRDGALRHTEGSAPPGA